MSSWSTEHPNTTQERDIRHKNIKQKSTISRDSVERVDHYLMKIKKMTPSNEAFAIVLAVVVVGAEAFAPPSDLNMANRNCRGSRRGRRTLARASIYYPEDDGRYTSDDGDDAPWSSSSSTTVAPAYDPSTFFGTGSASAAAELGFPPGTGHDYDYGGLLGRIADRLPRSTLARLASAYSPPGYDIPMEHVSDVRCRNLGGSFIEIEAVVCDSVECASLLVPVDFPEGCEADDRRRGGRSPPPAAVVMDCILRNVERLDVVGGGVIRERGEARRAYEALRSLGGGGGTSSTASPLGDDAEMPDWWEAPIADEDVSECDLMRNILNGDDMRDMVLELAANLVGGGWDVRDVRVDAVGPAGMVLRARLSAVGGGGTYDDDGTLADVPVRFADMISSGHSGSIRQRVLALF